jgi:GNAT superfamily N-acetyltransferase
VQITCFECDAPVEAGDVDTVIAAFVAHGQARHNWTYPEAAIRTYARNCAEAIERSTGSRDRLAQIGAVTIHPVAENRVDDWLRLFDSDAFPDNPGWASCYCLEPHAPPPPEQGERPWRTTRAIMIERLRSGTTFGYLAYAGGRTAGWVNASLRADYGLYREVDPAGPAPRSVIGVSCFVIAPPFRRHGIAAALLDRVVADASARSASWIEAYPLNAPKDGDAGHFRGPRAMYDARGFAQVELRGRYAVVRVAAVR